MPNAILRKDSGLLLTVPATSVTAILHTLSARSPEHPNAKSVVFMTTGGFSIDMLAMTAREAFEKIMEKGVPGREWLELPYKDDASYVLPNVVVRCEGVEVEREVRLRVWFNREDGRAVFVDADYSDELFEYVSGYVGGETPAAPDPTPVAKMKAALARTTK